MNKKTFKSIITLLILVVMVCTTFVQVGFATTNVQSADLELYITNKVTEMQEWIDQLVEDKIVAGAGNVSGYDQDEGITMTAYENAEYREQLNKDLKKVYTSSNRKLILAYYDQAISAMYTVTNTAEADYIVETFKVNVLEVDASVSAIPDEYDDSGVQTLLIVVLVLLGLVVVAQAGGFAFIFLKKRKCAKDVKADN